MSEDSTPPFQRAFQGISRVRKMLEVVSCAVSRYVRTFLRLGVRPDEAGMARDRSFSEGDIGIRNTVIRNSISREWPRSNSFTSLSFKTQMTHMSLCSLATPSFIEDHLLSVSRQGSKSLSAWNVSSVSNLDVTEEMVRSETPRYLGYGKKYDNIPWITTPRSLTASEHSGENSSSSPFSKKSDVKSPPGFPSFNDAENAYDTPGNLRIPKRPTSLLVPCTPAFNMSPRDFHFFNLRKKIWRNLYWQDAIKWEEDQAVIRDILRKQDEEERARLQIPELNLPPENNADNSNNLELGTSRPQSANSSNHKLDVPDITITFSDDMKSSKSTLSTALTWCSEKMGSTSNFQDSSSIDSSWQKSQSLDNISHNDENWACFDQLDTVDDKTYERLQTSV